MSKNQDNYWDDAYTPFRYEEAMAEHQKTIDAANEEVKRAIAAYDKKSAVAKWLGAIRRAVFWATYWVRLQLALFIVRKFAKDETHSVRLSQKVWNRLGL